MMLQVWYPAEPDSSMTRAPYFDQLDIAASVLAERLNLPSFFLGHVDLVETHDAFAPSELFNIEKLGLCGKGEGAKLLEDGVTEIGGKIPVNPSGGLMSRGHPIGPTTLAQVAEIVWQLRGQAGPRQIPDAKIGMAHTLGAGPNCSVIILKR